MGRRGGTCWGLPARRQPSGQRCPSRWTLAAGRARAEGRRCVPDGLRGPVGVLGRPGAGAGAAQAIIKGQAPNPSANAMCVEPRCSNSAPMLPRSSCAPCPCGSMMPPRGATSGATGELNALGDARAAGAGHHARGEQAKLALLGPEVPRPGADGAPLVAAGVGVARPPHGEGVKRAGVPRRAALELFGVDAAGFRIAQPGPSLGAEQQRLWTKLNGQVRTEIEVGLGPRPGCAFRAGAHARGGSACGLTAPWAQACAAPGVGKARLRDG